MISINNRQSPRFPVRCGAVILLPAGYADATVLNISLTGALIEVADPQPLPRSATCTLRLLSNSGRQLVEVETAPVRFAGDEHIGLTIFNLSPGAYGVLSRLIEIASDGFTRYEICAPLRRVDPAYAVAAGSGIRQSA